MKASQRHDSRPPFNRIQPALTHAARRRIAEVRTWPKHRRRDGNRNAVVWAISTKVWNGADNRAAVLYAFDAMDVTQPIYSSEQNSQRDRAGLATRFVFPVVVDGRVYFAARGEVDVYGLLH